MLLVEYRIFNRRHNFINNAECSVGYLSGVPRIRHPVRIQKINPPPPARPTAAPHQRWRRSAGEYSRRPPPAAVSLQTFEMDGFIAICEHPKSWCKLMRLATTGR